MTDRIARPLVEGELACARGIFGDAIDYARVRIHNRKAYFFQPANVAITPNGQIYFPPTSYRADFSTNAHDAAWLIHELVHVWQHQQGMWVRLLGMIFRRYAYGDLRGATRPFRRYWIEQQAGIVEDWYRITHGLRARYGTGTVADYERVVPFAGMQRSVSGHERS